MDYKAFTHRDYLRKINVLNDEIASLNRNNIRLARMLVRHDTSEANLRQQNSALTAYNQSLLALNLSITNSQRNEREMFFNQRISDLIGHRTILDNEKAANLLAQAQIHDHYKNLMQTK